jgi:hypothetical protein
VSVPVQEAGAHRRRFAFVLAALVVAELLWFLWFWTEPLPNAVNIQVAVPSGGTQSVPVRRWFLLALAVPQFITTWQKSLLGRTLNSLSHIEHLPQRLPLAGSGLLIAGAGLGLGLLLLRGLRLGRRLDRLERVALGFGLGLNLLASLTLLAGRLGQLHPWPVRIVLGLLAASGLAIEWRRGGVPRRAPWGWPLSRGQTFWLAAITAPFLLLMALGSFQPSVDFDALEYHLEGPKEWFLQGRIAFLPHNVYTSMPFSVEMLHLLGMELLDDWWQGALAGQFVIMLHAPAAALALVLLGSRLAAPRAGLVAAIAYLSTPWIYRLSLFSYVEGPLCYYHAALLLAVERAWALGRRPPAVVAESLGPGETRGGAAGLWAIVGGLAGGSMACKYPALVSAVFPAGLVALLATVRRREPSIFLGFAIGLAIAVGPWLVKNAIDHGNPVYPLGYSVFGGRPWSAGREAQWRSAHGPRPNTLPELATGVLDVAGRNDWQSPLYFALAPLAVCRRGSRRATLLLALLCAYIFATWWLFTHRLDRFWLPILPPLALLAGIGADWTTRRGWKPVLAAILGAGLLSNLCFDTSELAGYDHWTEELGKLRSEVPVKASAGLAWLDQILPDRSRTLLVGSAAVFHMRHEVLYNTVFDDSLLEALARDREPDAFHAELKRLGITHVFVDWSEVERYRKPGNYGFTDFVQPERFAEWVREGIMIPVHVPIPNKDLYLVR